MSSANTGGGPWISLFDGSTTTGWHTYGKNTIGKAWKAESGVLHLDASSKKDWQTEEGGDIVTNESFDNFHFSVEWKIAPLGNSGIMFFVKEDPKYQYPWNTGPEMQVLDNGTPTTPGHPDGKLYTHRAGDLYDLLAAKEVAKPAGEWNLSEIVADHGKLDFYMNGEHVLSTTMWDDNWRQMIANSKFKDMPGFGTFQSGKIALQDHGADVWFRNIRIKKL
ncbi:MAG: 3-keto-disaccharide hydrolase [Flavisolibacter sp.]